MISYDSLYKAMYKAILQSLNDSGFSEGEVSNLKVPSSAISIAAGANYDIIPPTGKRWTIINLYLNGQCDFKIMDGSTNTFETSFVTADALPLNAIITENHFIRITNTGSTALSISYEASESIL